MRMRLLSMLEYLRTSYWFLPSLMTLGALALGFVMVEVDRRLGGEWGRTAQWFYSGSAEGARSVLSTIAGSMIGVAGVVFSITIVTLGLATNQFGPRLLRNFMRDRGNQLVLGTFLATFLYCLTVLRVVYGDSVERVESFIPHISITIGFVLAAVSLGVLIFFIHHIAESIQAPNVIAAVSRDLSGAMDKLFPEQLGQGEAERHQVKTSPEQQEETLFATSGTPVHSPKGGYLRRIDAESLMRLAHQHDLTIWIKVRPGQYLGQGGALMLVRPADRVSTEVSHKIEEAFEFGAQRSLAQDIRFPLDQLVEVAVRALSPSINDPFTAMQCLDRLGEVFSRLAGRKLPSPYRYDGAGVLRVIACPVTFVELLDEAFGMIRHNCENSPEVMLRMLEVFGVILGAAHRDEDRVALRQHIAMVHKQALESISAERDLLALNERHQAALGEIQMP